MSGLKDLKVLLADVPLEEHVNIEITPTKWAVPFQGMWLGINSEKVPPLQPMTSLKLVDGQVFILFEDGTYIQSPYVSCIKESLEEIQAHTWVFNRSFDLIEVLNPWIEGLDYNKYLAIKKAKEEVEAANSRYQELLSNLGNYETGDSDYWHMVSRNWKIEGVPSITEWI